MKLIINTQCNENYGAHDWNGEGECPQYWKAKGGETYVVRNITEGQKARIKADGIPTLTKLINHSSDYSSEIITHARVVDDSKVECEPYETVVDLHYDGRNWIATRTTVNGDVTVRTRPSEGVGKGSNSLVGALKALVGRG